MADRPEPALAILANGYKRGADADTGRSKGFGFVQPLTAADGAAIEKGRAGFELQGRPLFVRPAEPKRYTHREMKTDA